LPATPVQKTIRAASRRQDGSQRIEYGLMHILKAKQKFTLDPHNDSFADKLLATLGQEFGEHAVETTSLNEAEREIA
jgi:hypothetical protein